MKRVTDERLSMLSSETISGDELRAVVLELQAARAGQLFIFSGDTTPEQIEKLHETQSSNATWSIRNATIASPVERFRELVRQGRAEDAWWIKLLVPDALELVAEIDKLASLRTANWIPEAPDPPPNSTVLWFGNAVTDAKAYGCATIELETSTASALFSEFGRLDELARKRWQDRYDALSVTTKDGLLASEWLLRTGTAERERDDRAREVKVLRDALRRACSLATTHRAEDRQEILELAKLAGTTTPIRDDREAPAERNRCRLARMRAGLNISQAARLLVTVDKSEIESRECSVDPIDDATIERMADLYGVSVDWMLGRVPRYDYSAVDNLEGSHRLEFTDRKYLAEMLASRPAPRKR